MSDPNFDAYQMIVPLMDFITRWDVFGQEDRAKVHLWIQHAGCSRERLLAIEAFLLALDATTDD